MWHLPGLGMMRLPTHLTTFAIQAWRVCAVQRKAKMAARTRLELLPDMYVDQ